MVIVVVAVRPLAVVMPRDRLARAQLGVYEGGGAVAGELAAALVAGGGVGAAAAAAVAVVVVAPLAVLPVTGVSGVVAVAMGARLPVGRGGRVARHVDTIYGFFARRLHLPLISYIQRIFDLRALCLLILHADAVFRCYPLV